MVKVTRTAALFVVLSSIVAAFAIICWLLCINNNISSHHFVYAQQQQQQYSFVGKWGTQGSGDSQFDDVDGIAITSLGNIVYASNSNGNPNPGSPQRIQEFTNTGTFITKWGSAGSALGQFINPFGIAIDSAGNVYVADQVNQRIQKFTSDGTFISSWTSSGPSNKFNYNTYGIAIDPSGNVYVADTRNSRIQKFTSEGAFVTQWGSFGTADGQFDHPQDVTVDSLSGKVYVADSGNHRIQVFALAGTTTTTPDTAITSAIDGNGVALQNGGSTVSTSITFQVTATTLGTNPIAGFECSLDGSVFSTCATATINPGTVRYNNLAAGQQHTFAVRAVDNQGNKDPTPGSFSWTILTSVQGIQQLLALSQSMNLNPSIQAMITEVLNSAVSILSDNNPSNDRAACNQLNALIYQLNTRAQHNNDQLTTAQATQLIQSSPYSLLAIERAQGCIQ